MKKILALVACLSLVASLAIGGSIAYLTDRDSDANIFTIGNVDITLNENYDEPSKLLPGQTITKEAWIENVGDTNAYVWMTIAVPASFDMSIGDESAIILDLGSAGEPDETTYWTLPESGKQENVEIDESGIQYTIYTLLYNNELPVGEGTNSMALNSVTLSKFVDITPEGDMYFVVEGQTTDLNWNINENDYPTVYVSAYAIQKDGFDDVNAAYEAYGAQWGENGTEYATPETTASTVDELTAALSGGANVILSTDITVDEAGALKVEGGTFNGGGKTINSDTTVTSGVVNAVLDVNSGEVTNINVVAKEQEYTSGVPRALYASNVDGNIYVSNSYFKAHYAMNVNAASEDYGLYADNCTFEGWSSYSAIKEAVFTNCTFDGTFKSPYYAETDYSMARVRPYADSTFDGCTFKGDVVMDAGKDGLNIAFTNCLVDDANGELVNLTAENIMSLLITEDNHGFDKCTVTVDGVAVDWQ